MSRKSDTFFSAHLAFPLKPDGELPHSRDGGPGVDEQRVGTLRGASLQDLGHPLQSEQARGGGVNQPDGFKSLTLLLPC